MKLNLIKSLYLMLTTSFFMVVSPGVQASFQIPNSRVSEMSCDSDDSSYDRHRGRSETYQYLEQEEIVSDNNKIAVSPPTSDKIIKNARDKAAEFLLNISVKNEEDSVHKSTPKSPAPSKKKINKSLKIPSEVFKEEDLDSSPTQDRKNNSGSSLKKIFRTFSDLLRKSI